MYSLEEMKNSNNTKSIVESDYIAYALANMVVYPDFYKSLISIMSPTIITYQRVILLPEIGAVERFNKNRLNGLSAEEAQYWANMLDISGVFIGIEYYLAERLSSIIMRYWNWRIDSEYPDSKCCAKVQFGNEIGEVYVTLAEHWP